MVIINTVKNNMLGIMTDGFIPEFDVLKSRYKQSLQNGAIKMEAASIEHKTLKRIFSYKNISKRNLGVFYLNFINTLQQNICPVMNGKSHFCYFTFYDTGIHNIESLISKSSIQRKNIRLLQQERLSDNTNKYYIQNLFMYSLDTRFHCNNIMECFLYSNELSGFELKKRSEYKNYQAYKKAWAEILHEYLPLELS